ncbi:ubiquitin thioesterase OTU1-like [Mercenaria mercenaria]|uniref:ubiquitin thioesterase OTU1-like n=1 Tax=Mercenaria mercenaria TaxID=6596 RepID=UPI001E1D4941|nr:ubiquitin thioesterase OTU1-like [Mercenaria mercenaria]
MALHLRCQSKAGQHYLTGLTLSSSIGKLKELICEATKIPKDCIKVRQGYPPKVIDLSSESKELSSLPFRSGDTLIVEEDSSLRKRRIEQVDKDIQDQITNSGGMLMRKVVPADNSCLFTSVDCVMNGGSVDLTAAPQMRELIAGIVMSDPGMYNEAFLGKSNANYCKWIMNKESWGGAIEISILSKYYDVEIDVVDTQTGRIDRFGEDMNYSKRVLVIYDGIHYDPLIMEPLIPGEEIKTIFSTKDESVLAQAMEIANEAKASRQYTDVGKFTLKCLICQKNLIGQKEAQEHAKASGHINFGEY